MLYSRLDAQEPNVESTGGRNIILANGRLYLCLTNTLFVFGNIRSAFGPRNLSSFQGEPLYWMFPGLKTWALYTNRKTANT